MHLLKRTPHIARSKFERNSKISKRYLSIHEYQSMGLLKQYGVCVPKGEVASSAEEAFLIAKSIGNKSVIKAQVLAGGRGKGTFDNGFQGGVKVANSPEEAKDIANNMLGHKLITKQTGDVGRPCNKVFIVEPISYDKEYYLAILLDRQSQGPVIVGSYRGGMDIEAVAKEEPSAIFKLPISMSGPLEPRQLDNFISGLKVDEASKESFKSQIEKLVKLFREKDASLVEINPMVHTKNGQIMCIDAKLNFDDNSSFRQKEIFSLRDTSQEDPREVKAAKYDLNYIGLEGNIGCLVNGAGLAMATMDIIKLKGGSPANFLDVGGSATTEQVSAAIGILASDPKVKAILVNIFGGIMKCDVVASGIIEGVRKSHVSVPVVVRLQGTNEEKAKQLMRESKLPVFSHDDLEDAAKKVVSLVK